MRNAPFLRRCVGCRTQRPKRDLIRVVRSPNGEVHLDPHGKMPGRGAYLCSNPECLKKAIRGRRFHHALGTSPPETVFSQLEELIQELSPSHDPE